MYVAKHAKSSLVWFLVNYLSFSYLQKGNTIWYLGGAIRCLQEWNAWFVFLIGRLKNETIWKKIEVLFSNAQSQINYNYMRCVMIVWRITHWDRHEWILYLDFPGTRFISWDRSLKYLFHLIQNKVNTTKAPLHEKNNYDVASTHIDKHTMYNVSINWSTI